jgi:hypothetical protein
MMTRERFLAGQTFDQMVATAAKNVELWTFTRTRASVDDDVVAAVAALDGPLYLAVLSEDWCIDSASTLPYIDALVSRVPSVELRILRRDENLDLMDAHLGNGHSRSIPVVIAYDEHFVERGWWGSRPSELKRLVRDEWSALLKDERNIEQRKWYARDRGRSTVREIAALLEQAAVQLALPAGAGAFPAIAATSAE